MYVVREIMHCKPGQVRPMVEKFKAMSKLTKQMGAKAFRVLTDVSGEQYWTVIAELEVEKLDMFTQPQKPTAADKKMEKIMKGYHDLIIDGRREIYKLEK